ncbi:MAG TPA: hypothetical protein VFH74_13415 [Gaiellales bacterium]|nr:hypothetical protein [Gaiellales bacterium]
MTACVITGNDEHEADAGYLCDRHLQKLARMLWEVEDESLRLEIRPSMAIGYEHSGHGLAFEQAPARLVPIAFRDPRTRAWEPWPDEEKYQPVAAKAIGPWCLFCDHETCTAWRAGRRRDLHDDEHDAGSAEIASILYELHNWARLIREERDLSAPEHVTITGERDALSRHLAWAAEQPWVDDMYRDVAKLLRQIKRLNNTLELPVGRCDSLMPSGKLCDGKVWHTEIRHENGPDEPGFRCGSCRRVWTGTEAVRLRDRMWRDEQERKAAG